MRGRLSYLVATAGRFTSGAGTVPTCLASTGSSLSQSLPPLRFLERYFDAPHSSLFSLRLPQWCFLASGLNASTTLRLSAFMNAIRASIGSPPRLHSISVDGDLPLRQIGLFLRQAGDVAGGITQRMK